MDIAPSARISIAPPLADTPRAGTPAPEAVRTELPPDASVQQGGKGEGTGRTRAEAASSDPNDYLDRSVTIDIETHKVIYQAIDDRTGEVVTQIPDPRYLKAYKDQLRSADEPEAKQTLAEKLA